MHAMMTKGRRHMPEFDRKKVYLLQVYGAGLNVLTDAIIPGDRIDGEIEELKSLYPDFKRIAVYEADTKEGVCMIRP